MSRFGFVLMALICACPGESPVVAPLPESRPACRPDQLEVDYSLTLPEMYRRVAGDSYDPGHDYVRRSGELQWWQLESKRECFDYVLYQWGSSEGEFKTTAELTQIALDRGYDIASIDHLLALPDPGSQDGFVVALGSLLYKKESEGDPRRPCHQSLWRNNAAESMFTMCYESSISQQRINDRAWQHDRFLFLFVR